MALVNESRNKDAVNVLQYVHKNELEGNYFDRGIDNSSKHQLGDITSTLNLLRTRFKLVTAMGNSGSCSDARPLIEEGLQWINSISKALDEIERNDDGNDRPDSTLIQGMKNSNVENKTYLLVAKSRCAADVAGMASAAYEAAVASPQMDYAMNHAESVGEIVQKIKTSGLNPREVLTDWEFHDDSSQTAKLTFKFKN